MPDSLEETFLAQMSCSSQTRSVRSETPLCSAVSRASVGVGVTWHRILRGDNQLSMVYSIGSVALVTGLFFGRSFIVHRKCFCCISEQQCSMKIDLSCLRGLPTLCQLRFCLPSLFHGGAPMGFQFQRRVRQVRDFAW